VLSKDNRILACGYNGTSPGFDNNCEDEIEVPVDIHQKHCDCCDTKYTTSEYLENSKTKKQLVTKEEVSHAEANLISFCAKNGIPTNGCDMHITLSPCVNCAKLMLNAGIVRVFYKEAYRLDDGIVFLKNHGIEVINTYKKGTK
jgi:dCMP deaminase